MAMECAHAVFRAASSCSRAQKAHTHTHTLRPQSSVRTGAGVHVSVQRCDGTGVHFGGQPGGTACASSACCP
eukprot:1162062-Pelagomonas_calceolata.AAC.1